MGWKEDKAVGDQGEAYVYKLALSRNHTIEDLTDNSYYWSKDIDFKIDGVFVEVKTDKVLNRTGNIWLEDEIEYLDNYTVGKGWWRKTEAQLIFYLDGINNDLYIYQKSDIEEYLKNHKVNKTYAVDAYQCRSGYCIPAKAIPHQFIQGISL